MSSKKVYDIVGKKKIFFAIPIVIIVATIIAALLMGVSVAIEFKGGTLLTYSYSGTIDEAAVKANVEKQNLGTVSVTKGSSLGSDLETITVSFTSNEGLTSDTQELITAELKKEFTTNALTLESSQDVNPSSGMSFFLKCAVAVVFSFIVLVIYIALRFKKISGWSAGVFAVVALLHDVFIVFATFVFFRLPIDSNFMAVVLTILGSSINNTIVIYDRIRENKTLYGKKLAVDELVNKSISQTLARTINTTTTTTVAVLAICVVAYLCGVNSIISFAFPMVVGQLGGFFSSVFLAGPMWTMWQKHKLKAQKKD